jgi:AcrR family transcriptional regulator
LPHVSKQRAQQGRNRGLEMRISGEERRKQILEAAREVCAEKGFAGTTLDDIADGAGVSRALVVQHFGSKEGVYEALSETAARAHPLEEDPRLQRAIEEKDDFGVFRACAEHVLEHNLQNVERSNLRLTVFSMLENPELFKRYAQARNGAWEGVISYIESRQAEGAFGPADARLVVEGFRSMVVHWAGEVMHREDLPQRESFYSTVDAIIELLLAGLRA